MRTTIVPILLAAVGGAAAQTRIYGVTIPQELSYLLPPGYKGDVDTNFIDTTTGNASIDALFASARNATWYSYDPEFDAIIGKSPTIQTIRSSNSSFTYLNEAGVWVPRLNQVYITASGDDPQPYWVLHLDDLTLTPPNPKYVQPPPATTGGTYHNGTVWLASFGLKSTGVRPGIYTVDPDTGSSSVALNTYFGIPFNPIDDVAWVTASGVDHLFFTSLDVSVAGGSHTRFSDPVLPNAIWRWTPSTNGIRAVIPRADVLAPNGVYGDPSGPHLYVNDVASTRLAGPGANSSGSGAVYRYDIDESGVPINKQLFSISRTGYADGIKVDNAGRVWAGEGNGVVVRNPEGRELGVFNGETLIEDEFAPISNFALAGDKLVILAGDKISVIQLGQNITAPAYTPDSSLPKKV